MTCQIDAETSFPRFQIKFVNGGPGSENSGVGHQQVKGAVEPRELRQTRFDRCQPPSHRRPSLSSGWPAQDPLSQGRCRARAHLPRGRGAPVLQRRPIPLQPRDDSGSALQLQVSTRTTLEIHFTHHEGLQSCPLTGNTPRRLLPASVRRGQPCPRPGSSRSGTPTGKYCGPCTPAAPS